ncbi:MAG: cell envelope integrity protein CreD [Acidobacteriota bacterium]
MNETLDYSVNGASDDEPKPPSFKRSILVNLAVLGGLILALWIPLAQIGGLVRERQARQAEVEHEIAGLWGSEQLLIGPLLTLRPSAEMAQMWLPDSTPPSTWQDCRDITVTRLDEKGQTELTTSKSVCHQLLPKTIEWRGTLAPEVRSRGLFDSVVYTAELVARGTFELPEDLVLVDAGWQIHAVDVGLGELRGLEQMSLRLGGREVVLRARNDGPLSLPQSVGHWFREGLDAGPTEFELTMRLRGSQALRFVAAGQSTTVELESSWPSPSFVGSTLPARRELSDEGFSAGWAIHSLARNLPALWQNDSLSADKLTASTFGVALFLPADQYQQVERALKYSLLFIVTTFGVLLLLEVMLPVRLHPMHFLLVGAGLVLFFLLLVALSEHVGITLAYALASSAIVLLLGAYSKSILHSWRAGGIVGGVVTTLYGYLFTLLRAESLSLLFGALGLFALLAAAMYLTRGLDWYEMRFQSPRRWA